MSEGADARLSPGLHAPPPARDRRFVVVERWVDCAAFPDGDPQRKVEFLHRQMNEEVNALEASARTLVDFPDVDWQVRLSLARQCSDESRHARMFRQVLERRGGWVGQYPVLNFQYRIVVAIDTLVGRLTVQNRSFEAGGIDAVESGIGDARRDGDEDLLELFEAQLADEVQHVRFANAAIASLKARDPRHLLSMGSALTQAAKAFREVMGREGTEGAQVQVATEARHEAGFGHEEIRMAGALAERLIAERAAAPPKPEAAR